MEKSFWERVSQENCKKKIEGGLIIFMQLENRYVLNGIILNSITKKWLRRAHMHIIFLWILKMSPCHWVTCLDNYPVLCDLLRLLWKLRESFFCRWVNRCFKQLRKILEHESGPGDKCLTQFSASTPNPMHNIFALHVPDQDIFCTKTNSQDLSHFRHSRW